MPPSTSTCLPDAVKALWDELYFDVTNLHVRWIIYLQLFGKSKERVAVLNQSASTAFMVIQESLLVDVQLTLCKIGDPAATGKRANLTLRQLQRNLETAGEAGLTVKLEPLLSQFELSCDSVRERRNKWLVHSDLATKLAVREKGAAVLTLGVSRQEIEDALKHLRAVMHCIEEHYSSLPTMFDDPILDRDGAYLAADIARAQRYRNLVNERKIPINDLRLSFPNGV